MIRQSRSTLFTLMPVILLGLLATACSPQRAAVRTYPLGEQADAGLLIYTALEAAWKSELGELPSVRMPQNRFLLVRMRITNSSPQEASVPAMSLIAQSGQTYTESTEGEGVEDWLGIVRNLKPNETLFGWVLFDVPRGDYQLRVSDDAFDPADAKIALIQIPLRLEARSEYLPEAKKNR